MNKLIISFLTVSFLPGMSIAETKPAVDPLPPVLQEQVADRTKQQPVIQNKVVTAAEAKQATAKAAELKQGAQKKAAAAEVKQATPKAAELKQGTQQKAAAEAKQAMPKKVTSTPIQQPGWQKKLAVGKNLDQDVYNRAQVLKPIDKNGIMTITVDNRVIRLVKANRKVVEIVK